MLDDYPVVEDVVVRWGDMDNLGHVNNTLYLQYFETARIEYLRRLGMEPPGPAWRECGMILASVTCRFKAPVTYPDTLSVGARVAAIGEDRVRMEHIAVSRELGKIAAVGDAVVVSYDYGAGRRAALPADLREAVIRLEGRVPPPLPPRGGAQHGGG